MKPKVGPAMIILRIFCAMVFLCVGFAHRTPVAVATDGCAVDTEERPPALESASGVPGVAGGGAPSTTGAAAA